MENKKTPENTPPESSPASDLEGKREGIGSPYRPPADSDSEANASLDTDASNDSESNTSQDTGGSSDEQEE